MCQILISIFFGNSSNRLSIARSAFRNPPFIETRRILPLQPRQGIVSPNLTSRRVTALGNLQDGQGTSITFLLKLTISNILFLNHGPIQRHRKVPAGCPTLSAEGYAAQSRPAGALYRVAPTHLESTQADVAQLVEQPIRNRQVIGSSPIVGSSLTPLGRLIY